MKRGLLLFAIAMLSWGTSSIAQDANPEEATNVPVQVFKDTRIVNGHSTETNTKGQLTFIIQHRFGRVNQGGYDLWGLDNATMRMGLDYGLTNDLDIGIGRSTFEKTFDGYAKYAIMRQGSKRPLSITAVATVAYKNLRIPEGERALEDIDRLFYTYQLLFARKISDRLSIQIMPTVVHRNLVPTPNEEHDVPALGGAFKFQLSKQGAIQAEAYAVDRGILGPGPTREGFYAPISLGFDVETKGHVFQFHLSNSRGMVEKLFITETTGNWLDGDIHFGFNITRDFRIRGRK